MQKDFSEIAGWVFSNQERHGIFWGNKKDGSPLFFIYGIIRAIFIPYPVFVFCGEPPYVEPPGISLLSKAMGTAE